MRKIAVRSAIRLHVIIFTMLPVLHLEDILRLRKPHPCGSYEWKIIRLGADIGLVCQGCGRKVLMPRRELSRKLKKVVFSGPTPDASQPS
jgi:hypothetical protein